jgi:hypothetical protein
MVVLLDIDPRECSQNRFFIAGYIFYRVIY